MQSWSRLLLTGTQVQSVASAVPWRGVNSAALSTVKPLGPDRRTFKVRRSDTITFAATDVDIDQRLPTNATMHLLGRAHGERRNLPGGSIAAGIVLRRQIVERTWQGPTICGVSGWCCACRSRKRKRRRRRQCERRRNNEEAFLCAIDHVGSREMRCVVIAD